jgi:hypothetical protein
MHIEFATALVVVAFVSSIVLVTNRGDKIFPIVAAVACGIEALILFHVLELSSGKFRIDVILPAVIAIAGAVSWARASAKSTTTAATLVTTVGAIQLLSAIHILQ